MGNLEDRPVRERLAAGAKFLGDLWRKGIRCEGGWRALSDRGYPDCPCKTKTKFCIAKIQWLLLAVSEGRELSEGPFGTLETMTVKELDLSGVTIVADIAGMAGFQVGSRGSARAQDLVDLARDPKSATTVLSLMKGFPGSRMEFGPAP